MSFARDLGTEAAASGLTAAACPYAGRNASLERIQAGSERLRRRWIDGYELEKRRQIKRRAARNDRRGHPIKSEYAKRRLIQIEKERDDASI